MDPFPSCARGIRELGLLSGVGQPLSTQACRFPAMTPGATQPCCSLDLTVAAPETLVRFLGENVVGGW